MKTFQRFEVGQGDISAAVGWYLADLGEARGKQELFRRQSPQMLKVLREHAIIESAVSSNRIEGVTVDQARLQTVLSGKSQLRDRNEEEVRGYRNALKRIHDQHANERVSVKSIQELHRIARAGVGDAGEFKTRDSDIIERYANGTVRVRFRPVPAAETPHFMDGLVESWHRCLQERWFHPLIALGAFSLDFLCIHPFRDGNGRASRLLLLLQTYHLGFEVGRYISLERLIEENKERYYETLEIGSQGWHEGKHDPWPHIGYILFILKEAYRELEERVGQLKSPRGAKTELVLAAVNAFPGEFALVELERACPGVSRDMLRRVLGQLRRAGQLESRGRGPAARWRKKR
ncbi:MAG TPA: Fic family protein [Vicinamibacteria bacterium]|nr:Fic family protein [Vicinamibacteria bacterium]